MQNILHHETWVSTAMIQTLLMYMPDISAVWTNLIFYSWEWLLKTELLQQIVGAGLWQFSFFPPKRSGKLFGIAAVPLWSGSHVVSPLDQCVMVRYALAIADAVWWSQGLMLVLVDRRKMWQSPRPKRTLDVPGNGTLRYLIAKAGQWIKSVTLEDSFLLVAYEDFWEKGRFLLTSVLLISKSLREQIP